MDIQALVNKQRAYFSTGATRPLSFRIEALNRLEKGIHAYEERIEQALYEDLHKSRFEGYMTEVGMVLSELGYVRKYLAKWAKPEKVRTPIAQFPAKSFVVKEPYGCTLIMSPWNYPFQLSLEPLIGALAAGNCCMVKPSAYASCTSQVVADLIGDIFPPEYAAVVQGGREENGALLDQRFDYIFFTGGVEVGTLVMEKAARHLTPVTLELGGKSPCMIDETADLVLAARRLAFGKCLNSGQTCVAPDYLLVQESVKDEVVKELKKNIRMFLGEKPLDCPDYPKMINEKHYHRVLGLLDGENVIGGGGYRDETLQIEPTLVDCVGEDSPLMQEEIFGPVLPIITFDRLDEAITFIGKREKPLALYFFSQDKSRQDRVLRELSFGGGCINDTIIHLATSYLGFGGVGGSGMGSYHGKDSFMTFSHRKSIVKKSNRVDLKVRYHPYTEKKEKMLKKFMK